MNDLPPHIRKFKLDAFKLSIDHIYKWINEISENNLSTKPNSELTDTDVQCVRLHIWESSITSKLDSVLLKIYEDHKLFYEIYDIISDGCDDGSKESIIDVSRVSLWLD